MKKHIGSILRTESYVVLVLGLAMLLSLIVAVLNHEANAIKAFMVPVLVCFIISSVGLVNYNHCKEKLLIRETNLLIVLSLLVAILIGAIPFIKIPGMFDTVDALFESCSAFTTTGASVVHSMTKMPKSIILWRSMAGWLGGLGVVFIITMHMNIKKAVVYIYMLFTGACFVSLIFTGNSLFDASILALSTISTTGFSVGSTGVSALSSLTKLVIIIFMISSGISYIAYYNASKKGFQKGLNFILKDPEIKFYGALILIITIEVGIINCIHARCTTLSEITDHFFSSFFYVASTISTTGFTAEPYFMWPTSSLILLLGLTMIGGCANSPSSGIECKRILIEYKLIRRNLAMRLHPNRVAKITYNNSEISTSEAISVSNFVLTYIVILFFGVLVLSTDNLGFMESFSAALSCMSNLGQGLGVLNSLGNYVMFNDFSKFACMILMIIGRLEIFPFLTLFSKYYWNPNSSR